MTHAAAASFKNRDSIERSVECACYQCLSRFPPSEIAEYIDDEQTPLCPRCRIDSVLASHDYDGTLPDHAALEALREQWFGVPESLTSDLPPFDWAAWLESGPAGDGEDAGDQEDAGDEEE